MGNKGGQYLSCLYHRDALIDPVGSKSGQHLACLFPPGNSHSYLRASIGFILAALLAGKYPKKIPIPMENPRAIRIPPRDGLAG